MWSKSASRRRTTRRFAGPWFIVPSFLSVFRSASRLGSSTSAARRASGASIQIKGQVTGVMKICKLTGRWMARSRCAGHELIVRLHGPSSIPEIHAGEVGRRRQSAGARPCHGGRVDNQRRTVGHRRYVHGAGSASEVPVPHFKGRIEDSTPTKCKPLRLKLGERRLSVKSQRGVFAHPANSSFRSIAALATGVAVMA